MKLSIYRTTQLVGVLATTSNGLAFSYDRNYRGPGCYPISVSMPILEEPYAQNIAMPFFDGLLPEGEQRRELSEILHVSSTSVMKLLAALAGECVGDLILVSENMDINEVLEGSGYTQVTSGELETLLRPQSIERLRFLAARRLSLAGAQAKIGLYRNRGEWFATQGLAPTTHIIKPSALFDNTVLVNEFFMMRLAKSCGLTVPETWVIQAGQNYGLVIERFDRVAQNDEIIRVGQEDFCQALSISPLAKYEGDGGPGLAELFTTVLHNALPPLANMRSLLRIALFNYLIGNCDAHAKNFSLLRRHDNGQISVAPAYDLVCTTFYGERLLRSMAMRIGRHSHIDRIDQEDFRLFAEESGINIKVIADELHALYESIVENIDAVMKDVASEISEYAEVASKLREHILHELATRVVTL
ncbi:MAG: HipA domain-containing protein [Coriobacteriales bacterium]|jgi:serine/threonine-protein kinase HipA|nr:HipA domain-containing protein [Coriobacteriales bacterium]